MSDLELTLREIVNSYKADNLPITMAVKDASMQFNIPLARVYLLIDQLLHEDSEGGMSYAGNKDIPKDYVEKRFKGEV